MMNQWHKVQIPGQIQSIGVVLIRATENGAGSRIQSDPGYLLHGTLSGFKEWCGPGMISHPCAGKQKLLWVSAHVLI
jgi:hypothetical protein